MRKSQFVFAAVVLLGCACGSGGTGGSGGSGGGSSTGGGSGGGAAGGSGGGTAGGTGGGTAGGAGGGAAGGTGGGTAGGAGGGTAGGSGGGTAGGAGGGTAGGAGGGAATGDVDAGPYTYDGGPTRVQWVQFVAGKNLVDGGTSAFDVIGGGAALDPAGNLWATVSSAFGTEHGGLSDGGTVQWAGSSSVINVYAPGGVLTTSTRVGTAANPAVAYLRGLVILGTEVVTAGHYQGQVTLGGAPYNAAGANNTDPFFQRYSVNALVPTQTLVKGFGNTGLEAIHDVRAAPDGGFYSVGVGGSTVLLGQPTELTNNVGGNPRLVVARWNAAGNLVWANTTAGGQAYAARLASDVAGNVVTGGNLRNGASVLYDGTFFQNQPAVPPGAAPWARDAGSGAVFENGNPNLDVPYVARYQPNGQLAWMKAFDVTNCSSGGAVSAVALNASGQTIAIGRVSANCRVTLGTVAVQAKTNSGAGFAVMLDATGNVVWARELGVPVLMGSELQNLRSLALDSAGNAYVVGNYRNEVQFDGRRIQGVDKNIFVLSLDPSGALRWVESLNGTPLGSGPSAGNTYNDRGYEVVAAADGSFVYVAGMYGPCTTFAGLAPPPTGASNVFVAKLRATP